MPTPIWMRWWICLIKTAFGRRWWKICQVLWSLCFMASHPWHVSRLYPSTTHFVMNAHFVNSEQIQIYSNQDGEEALGTWMMLQCSTFQSKASHLNAAKLRVTFKKQSDGGWKIKHFQTENIFSRPVTHWHSTDELPVPKTDALKDQASVGWYLNRRLRMNRMIKMNSIILMEISTWIMSTKVSDRVHTSLYKDEKSSTMKWKNLL